MGILNIFTLYEAKEKGDIKSYIPALFKESSAINLKCGICSASNLLLPDDMSPPDTIKTKNNVGIQN